MELRFISIYLETIGPYSISGMTQKFRQSHFWQSLSYWRQLLCSHEISSLAQLPVSFHHSQYMVLRSLVFGLGQSLARTDRPPLPCHLFLWDLKLTDLSSAANRTHQHTRFSSMTSTTSQKGSIDFRIYCKGHMVHLTSGNSKFYFLCHVTSSASDMPRSH